MQGGPLVLWITIGQDCISILVSLFMTLEKSIDLYDYIQFNTTFHEYSKLHAIYDLFYCVPFSFISKPKIGLHPFKVKMMIICRWNGTRIRVVLLKMHRIKLISMISHLYSFSWCCNFVYAQFPRSVENYVTAGS